MKFKNSSIGPECGGSAWVVVVVKGDRGCCGGDVGDDSEIDVGW